MANQVPSHMNYHNKPTFIETFDSSDILIISNQLGFILHVFFSSHDFLLNILFFVDIMEDVCSQISTYIFCIVFHLRNQNVQITHNR